MSELVISAEGFVIQPLVDLRDGPCEIRWWYSRSFLESGGVQVNWGTGTTGFWITTPCSIADGLITVDLDTTLWTTDNAQDPSPASIFLSAALYTARGKLIQQLTIANKAQWIVPSSLAPTTSWENFSAYNQAVFIANPPVVFYTAAQVDALVDRAFDEHPATDTELGTVVLSIPSDNPDAPPVWGLNDPLVRDAIKIQGVDVSDTAPLDSQTLIYNQATNQYEPSNQNPGTGNVVSNEVSSVDGELVLFSGTGGKTIKRGDQTGILAASSGVVAVAAANESTLVGRGEGSAAGALQPITLGSNLSMTGDTLNVSGAAGGDIKADGTVPFAADESMGGFNLTNLATPDDLTDAANKDFVLNTVAAAVQQTPNISALVSGGGVLWESNYNFRVSAATYLIQGDLFTSTEQTITLDAADPALDRIDVIALDSTGTVVKITGTAAAQPSQPDIDPATQLQLTFVFVGAATTEPPNVTNEDIYIDNTEWTATTSGSGWDPNSTNNPHSGTKDIEGTNVANNAYVQLEAPAPLTLDPYALLSVFIRSKATWPKNRSLLFQWYSAGVAKGLAITVNSGFFGFDSSQTASYQLLAIPLTQFAIPAGTSINQLRITDKGGAIGMYIDDLVLQAFGGDIGTPPTPGLTQEQADARYTQRANDLSDLNSAATARTNLGLGALATVVPGTGVATALAVNVGSAGAFITFNGALGTPSSGTLTSCTGLPVATGISGLGANVATFLGTPSSANLAAALTDETGSGAAVFGTSPTILTPVITSPQTSLTAAHGSDDTYTGTTITGLNAGATIAQWEAVYLDGSSTWQLADANGTNTYPSRGLAVAAYSSTNPATVLVLGTVRNDAWNWTPGGTIYLSGTPGGLTQTAPSTSGDQVQQVGYALTADIAFFDFNSTYLTVT